MYQLLKSKKYTANFIGTRQNGLDESFKWPINFDLDHEGYYGKKTAYVKKEVVKNLSKLEKPDWAIIHLGTNDNEISQETISKPIKHLIEALRAKNPKIKILLVQIPGWKNLTIHLLIWAVAKDLSSNESPIETIPLYIDWDTKKDTFDGAHPNQSGQQKMAKIFYDHITSE